MCLYYKYEKLFFIFDMKNIIIRKIHTNTPYDFKG